VDDVLKYRSILKTQILNTKIRCPRVP